jgi:hypothetical protein
MTALPDMMHKLLDAMVAHDFRGLPLTADARYTENGQTLEFGDGLWGTLTGYVDAAGALNGRFRIDMTDAARAEAVYFGAIVETTTPGVLALRMKLRGTQISEIEALAVRVETAGERGGTVALFQPPLMAQLDAASFDVPDPALLAPVAKPADPQTLTAIVDRYFDAVRQGSSRKASLAADCRRRDNGVRTTGNPQAAPLDPAVPAYRPFALGCAEQIDSGYFANFTRLRGLRHLAVDPARGLVLSVAALDQPGDVQAIDVAGVGRVAFPAGATADELASTEGTPQFYVKRHETNCRVPLTQLLAQLTRIEDDRIVQMESISRPAPYGVNTGWT